MTAEEFQQLEANIIKDGCRDALVIWNDTLIDGHNRYQICTENDIPFQTVDKSFDGKDDAIEWIIKNQFGRRNINTAQRCNLVLILEPIVQAKAKNNMIAGGGDKKSGLPKSDNPIDKVHTNEKLAKEAGVGHNTIHQFRVIKNEGKPELVKQVIQGEVSINKAYNEIRKPEIKTCIVCGKEKPLSEFYSKSNECKKCRSSRASAGMTAAKTRELNAKYPDELLNSYYDEMRNHDTPSNDAIVSSKSALF